VRKQKEPSADCRALERRSTIFQRALFLAFRTTISASHQGVLHKQGGNTGVEFPRVLLYLADQPEDKSVLLSQRRLHGVPLLELYGES